MVKTYGLALIALDRDAVTTLVKALAVRFGISAPAVVFADLRAERRSGRYEPLRHVITISRMTADVVAHEVAHAVARFDLDHGRAWQRAHAAAQRETKRLYSLPRWGYSAALAAGRV